MSWELKTETMKASLMGISETMKTRKINGTPLPPPPPPTTTKAPTAATTCFLSRQAHCRCWHWHWWCQSRGYIFLLASVLVLGQSSSPDPLIIRFLSASLLRVPRWITTSNCRLNQGSVLQRSALHCWRNESENWQLPRKHVYVAKEPAFWAILSVDLVLIEKT